MSNDNLSIILALTSIGISSYVLRIWRDGGAQ